MATSTTPFKRRKNEILTDNILTPEERRAFTLYRKTPGLKQQEIADLMGVAQCTVCRWIESAEKKVAEIRSLFAASGFDDDIVDRWLATDKNASA